MSFSIPLLAPSQLEEVDKWLRSVLWESEAPSTTTGQAPIEIHRLKARLVFDDGTVKIVQGVREIFEIIDGQKADSDVGAASQMGKIVLIGRNIQNVDVERSLLDRLRNKSA